jgi:poly(hydroxyalkanoate) granule-associated protein
MARSKQIMARKAAQKVPQDPSRKLWYAGLGAVALARKHGERVLGTLASEGEALATRATRYGNDFRVRAARRIGGIVTPLRKAAAAQFEAAANAAQHGVGRTLARLGVPSKADIEELSQRVAALSRQLRAKSR